MDEAKAIKHAGHPRHPDHREFLEALGAAMFMAASVNGHMVDIARKHLDMDYWELIRLPMGLLKDKLVVRAEEVDGLAEAIPIIIEILALRNALAHALPVRDGLHYRPKDRSVINFYDVEDLRDAERRFSALRKDLNRVLHPR